MAWESDVLERGFGEHHLVPSAILLAPRNPMNVRLRFPLVALLALVLLAPTVGMGFYADDYLHQSVLEGADERVPMRPWGLFDFGSREDWRRLDGSVGSFPWWTGEDWRVRFFRPLTSIVIWGEFALFGGWAPGYHLLGIGLFVLLLALVGPFYRALGLAPGTALLGTLLVALSHTAVLPAGWPANLNSLLAALCATGSMTVLLGSREPSPARLGAGLALAVGAALANESGVVALLLAALVCALHARVASPARQRLRLASGIAVTLVLAHLGWLFFGGWR